MSGSGFASSVRVQIEEILYKYHILDWRHRRELEKLFRAISLPVSSMLDLLRIYAHLGAAHILDMAYLARYFRSSERRQLAGAMLFVEPWMDTSPHNLAPTSDEPR